jgi:hypothetical protein
MVSMDFALNFALGFDETVQAPHMEVISVKVKKKIFITLNEKMKRVCIKLSHIDQDVFCNVAPLAITPVPNAWGKQGWTLITLSKIRKDLFKDAVTCAYCNVAPQKLADKYQPSL